MLSRSQLFFFNDTATTEIYTLSLHDALPISVPDNTYANNMRQISESFFYSDFIYRTTFSLDRRLAKKERLFLNFDGRSEEHTSELQSRQYLVCRLLLEKKKTIKVLQLL